MNLKNTFRLTRLSLFKTLQAFCLLALGAAQANAYLSTIDTGELIAPKKYQLSFEPQLILSRYNGLNAIARLDTGLTDESSLRGILGVGVVNFQIGGMYKMIPYPDLPKQPAVGFETGVVLARIDGRTDFNFRFQPIVSKRFETEIGDVIPYATLPLGLTIRTDKTVIPAQLVGGAELQFLNNQNLSVFGELGLNLNEAFSYISAAVAWRFDDSAFPKTKR